MIRIPAILWALEHGVFRLPVDEILAHRVTEIEQRIIRPIPHSRTANVEEMVQAILFDQGMIHYIASRLRILASKGIATGGQNVEQ